MVSNIEARLVSIIYNNKENNFIIASFNDGNEDFTAKGTAMVFYKNMRCRLTGSFYNDAHYGRQFHFTSLEEILPSRVDGIKEYLASKYTYGIGPVIAERITDHFGERTLEIIKNTPERLKEVPGIGKKKLKTLLESLGKNKGVEDIMIFLKSMGISDALASKVYNTFGDNTVQVIKDNPYVLMTLDNIGFIKADAYARNMDISPTDPMRIEKGILFTLDTAVEKDGHTFLPMDVLLEKASGYDILGISRDIITPVLKKMIAEKTLINDKDRIYSPEYYNYEHSAGKAIFKCLIASPHKYLIDIGKLETDMGYTYSDDQKNAIVTALSSNLFVLTGGPGTGKTTTCNGIVKAFTMAGKRIMLAAPTGRAAKQLSDKTGLRAKTLHRLLGVRPQGGFEYDRNNPLTCDVLLVDEMSMVDIRMFSSLMDAVVPGQCQVVLVGDPDQLPSIGSGNVLHDLLASGSVPTVHLSRIFRQENGSQIVDNAHDICSGKEPSLWGRECEFIEETDNKTISDIVVRRYADLIDEGVSPDDIQILSPVKKENDVLGTKCLNDKIRDMFRPDEEGPVFSFGDKMFRMGDRVIQLKNDYSKDIVNGDIGYVEDIDGNQMTVSFIGSHTVIYEKCELNELSLAYAVTIHKSQGSEYKYVIIPVTRSHIYFFTRRMLYTALTRARTRCIFIGESTAIKNFVRNTDDIMRYTNLAEHISISPCHITRRKETQKSSVSGFPCDE